MKVEEVDALLEKLSQEYGVSKPRYTIAIYKIVKKLEPVVTPLGGKIIQRPDYPKYSFKWGSFDHSNLKFPYIILTGGKRGMSKHDVIHEFFHYYHYVKNDGEVSNEKLVEKETKVYMRKGRRPIPKVRMEKLWKPEDLKVVSNKASPIYH